MTLWTGLGSLPGTDLGAAARLALDAPLPWLAELPARGAGAALVGRTAGLLEGLGAELLAGEWRLSDVPGIDQRRARAALRDDLDVLEEHAQGHTGPLKVSIGGPWTLAASLLRPRGGRVLADRGARRDVAQSLAAGASELVADLARRLPGAQVRLQVDEPSLPAVLAGRVPTEGGYFRHRAVEEAEVSETLACFSSLTPDALVHCCAPDVPAGLLTASGRHGAGFAGLSLDGTLVPTQGWERIAEAVENGTTLYLGCTDARAEDTGPDPIVRRALGWLRPLELGPVLADRLVLTHTCGLAGADPRTLRRSLESLARAAEHVDDGLRS